MGWCPRSCYPRKSRADGGTLTMEIDKARALLNIQDIVYGTRPIGRPDNWPQLVMDVYELKKKADLYDAFINSVSQQVRQSYGDCKTSQERSPSGLEQAAQRTEENVRNNDGHSGECVPKMRASQ
jgi:hypothetical protein